MRAPRILWILLLAGCSAAGGQAPPSARIDLLAGLERRELPNGLAVVVKEDRRLPRATVMLAYRVGSVNEDPGITGVSHFFEHMVFKGTEKYKRGDIDLVTYRCGGENNAFTTHDMTGYWFHVDARHVEEIFDILADTMGNCTLEPREFEAEKNTVLQEMNIWLDGPWGRLERELESAVYRESRYRHPVLGWKEDVENLTRDRMMEYYKAFYRPNNASLVVLGDVRKEEVFLQAEKHFGKIPRGKDASGARAAEPPQEAERVVDLKTDKTADRLMMAFRADRAGTEADIVLDVVSTILGEGRTSRLNVRLVEKEDLAGEGDVNVSNYSRRHEGLFTVQVQLALEAPLDKTRAVVVEELEALQKHPVPERELRRAKNILRAHFAFEAESQYALAERIGYFEALGLPDYVREYMDRVEAVTPAKILEVARRVFRAENRTVALGRAKVGRSGAPPASGGVRGAGSRPPGAFRRKPVARAALSQEAPEFGPMREVRLDNGLTLLVKPRRDVPVLAVTAFVDAGPLHEPEDKAGLAVLTGDLLDEGIEDPAAGRRRSAEELAAEIEFVGGTLTTGSSGASAKVLSEHAGLAFDLLRDVLRHPAFPADRVEKLREDQVARIEAQDDDPAAVARRLFYEEAYKGHPLHRPAVGYKAAVEKLTREDVLAHHRRLFRPENTIVAVAGDIDPGRAEEEVRARFGGWRGEGEWKAPAVPPASRQAEPRRVFSTYSSRQVRFHLGHVGVERSSPDWFALRVTESILCASAGFTNRLAKNVRDVQGLAYDVGGSLTAGAGKVAGPFQVVLGTEAKDKDRGLEAAMAELRRFLEEGPSPVEVEDARRYLLGSFVSAWETTDELAAYMVEVRRHGLGADYPARFHRAVSAVTPEEVRRAARKTIDLANLTLVVVGPVDREGKLLRKEEGK